MLIFYSRYWVILLVASFNNSMCLWFLYKRDTTCPWRSGWSLFQKNNLRNPYTCSKQCCVHIRILGIQHYSLYGYKTDPRFFEYMQLICLSVISNSFIDYCPLHILFKNVFHIYFLPFSKNINFCSLRNVCVISSF